MKPELARIEGNVANVIAAMPEVFGSAMAYQSSVLGSVDAMLKSIKEELIESLREGNIAGVVHPHQTCAQREARSNAHNVEDTRKGIEAVNDAIIHNVLGNLSHYSTPPAAQTQCPGSDGHSNRHQGHVPSFDFRDGHHPQLSTVSGHSQTKVPGERNVSQGISQRENIQVPSHVIVAGATSQPVNGSVNSQNSNRPHHMLLIRAP
ncbi:unnamed protein product [Eruca vesicaria subsp. sativa]|uniref:Uncharacterized protein n=1 Tax=Eruca vesicaria subsp. sativa TaxID=29727 RepID=A0ABC8JUV3_ERUVS|nr:unnamed protein product [Eruca vesicaria subsp. sativa]